MSKLTKLTAVAGLSLLMAGATLVGTAHADALADCKQTAEPAKAIPACALAIKEGGKDLAKVSQAYTARSAANEKKGDFKAALDDIYAACLRDPKNPDLWYRSGMIRMLQTKPQPIRATADMSIALKYDPKFVPALSARADLYRQLGLLPKAIADADALIKIDPKSSAAYATRGYAQLRAGQPDKAAADAEEAIKLDPKSAFGYLTRGLVAQGKKDKDKAVADLKKVIEIDPKNTIAAKALKDLGV
jgi:tetratricopeptide (TPR) repeat protein